MFLEMIEDDGLRALVGSFMLVGGMVCMWYCVYKYAVCQDNINRRNQIHQLPPRVYSSIESQSHTNCLTVIPSQPSHNDKFVGTV